MAHYPGVDPHLNSRLQDGHWESFHVEYIIRMVSLLDERLPGQYYALAEKSLQVSVIDPMTDTQMRRPRQTVPDVVVVRTTAPTATAEAQGSTPTLMLPLKDQFTDEGDLMSVVVYRVEGSGLRGTPVTRIELLSPSNKARRTAYLDMRYQTLRGGLNLVEIDLLHEQPPLLGDIPVYPGEPNSFPYHILVSDPHPAFETGFTSVHSFGVGQPFPEIVLPLEGETGITVNFGEAYQAAVQGRRAFALLTDYAEPPARFDTYSAADQAVIRERMQPEP